MLDSTHPDNRCTMMLSSMEMGTGTIRVRGTAKLKNSRYGYGKEYLNLRVQLIVLCHQLGPFFLSLLKLFKEVHAPDRLANPFLIPEVIQGIGCQRRAMELKWLKYR
ncbi:hypothetical protein HanOQP8_Chr15g0580301 [Helianthus annuus]|nr:hypothetical protein HanOQP8_Chr15g0580301 [Helianthus annuus]